MVSSSTTWVLDKMACLALRRTKVSPKIKPDALKRLTLTLKKRAAAGWLAIEDALPGGRGRRGLWSALIALVLAHAAAAFYHHIHLRDATLARMLPQGWLNLPQKDSA